MVKRIWAFFALFVLPFADGLHASCGQVIVHTEYNPDFCNITSADACVIIYIHDKLFEPGTIVHVDYSDGSSAQSIITHFGDSVEFYRCFDSYLLSNTTITVTVTAPDDVCTHQRRLMIVNPWIIEDVTCPDGLDGSISTPFDSTYGHVWSNGSTESKLTSLSAGTYTVTITDPNGCSITPKIILSQPPAISAIGTLDCSNGAINTIVSGGTPYNPKLIAFRYDSVDPIKSPPWIEGYVVDTAMFSPWYFYKEVFVIGSGVKAYWKLDCLPLVHCNNPKLIADICRDSQIPNEPDTLWIYAVANGTNPVLLKQFLGQGGLSTHPNYTHFEFPLPEGKCIQVLVEALTHKNFYSLKKISIECQSINTDLYDYLWCDGSTSSILTNYSDPHCLLTVTDFNGCITVVTPDLRQDPNNPLVDTIQNIDCDGISVKFINNSSTGGSVHWDFGDGTTSTEREPEHRFTWGEDRIVTVRLGDGDLCTYDFNLTIQLSSAFLTENISMPNVFTPNEDGINDEFQIKSKVFQDCLEIHAIYNRWGINVFHGGSSWGGKNKSGILVPEGTYYYVAHVANNKLSGYITLIR